MVRAVLLGMSCFYSQAFASALQRLPGVELVAASPLGQSDETLKALTGKDSRDFAREYVTEIVYNAEELPGINEGVNCALIASHDREKPNWAAWALQQGLHVFVSKPLAATYKAAKAMVEAASRQQHLLCGTLSPARYDGAIRALKEQVEAGAIGKVLSARVYIQHRQAPGEVPPEHTVFGYGAGGSEFSLGFYAADLLNWVLDAEPSRVYCEAGNFNSPGFAYPDLMHGTIRYVDGRIASMSVVFTTDCPAPSWELEVIGETGIIRTQQAAYEGLLWSQDRAGATSFYRNQNDVLLEAMADWVKAVDERLPAPLSWQEALKGLKVCAGWRKAWVKGAPVDLLREEADLD